MNKIIEFFKQKLSIATSEELPSQYIDKIKLLQSGIKISEIFTESVGEQLDAVLKEFQIDIKARKVEEIKNISNVLKSFELKISENGEGELLQKLELITAMSKWHGFSNINKISESKLLNLKALYSTLAGSELNDISYEVFNKVRKINLSQIKQLAKLSSEELSKFTEFCKAYGISTKLEMADLIKTNELNEILKILRIENSWTSEANQKQITALFKASGIVKINDISLGYTKSLLAIKKEFQVDFSKLSQLKLNSKIEQLSSLNITFNSKAEEIESIAKFVKQFCKTEDLNSFDAAKITKIAEVLGIKTREARETSQAIELIKSFGIKLSLSEDLENELGRIKKISTILKSIFDKEIAELSIYQIKEASNLVELLTKNKIVSVSDKEIEQIQKVFKFFPIQNESKALDVKKLQQVLVALGVELKEINKIENLSINFKKLNLDIWNLDKREIQKIQELLGYLDISITKGEIAETNKEKYIKIKEYFGANYQKRDIEKINKLASVVGKDRISDLEVEEISKLKLITEELGIDIITMNISEIERVMAILSGYDVKSAESKQSTISKLWNGKNKAIIDKITEIKAIFENFGYPTILGVEEREKVKFDNILKIYGKGGLGDITLSISQNIQKFFQGIKVSFKDTNAWDLKGVISVMHKLGVNLFTGDYEELEGYQIFFQEFNIDCGKLDTSRASSISKILSELGINKAKLKEESIQLKQALNQMGFAKITEVTEAHIIKIKAIANSIETQELNITILKNTAQLCSKLGVMLVKPALDDLSSKILLPEEGVMNMFRSLQQFNIHMQDDLGIKHKLSQLGYVAHKYLECGNKVADKVSHKKDANKQSKEKIEVSLDGKEEVMRIILAQDQSILNSIAGALEKSESCQRHFDANLKIEQECKDYFSGIDEQIGKLCTEQKEDL